jgi:hypothetical protein
LLLLTFAAACGPPPPLAHDEPRFLAGTYSRGTRITDCFTDETGNRALRIEPEGRYAFRSEGDWQPGMFEYDGSISPAAFELVSGPLTGRRLSLAAMSSNCRIVEWDGELLFRDDRVPACPLAPESAPWMPGIGQPGRPARRAQRDGACRARRLRRSHPRDRLLCTWLLQLRGVTP